MLALALMLSIPAQASNKDALDLKVRVAIAMAAGLKTTLRTTDPNLEWAENNQGFWGLWRKDKLLGVYDPVSKVYWTWLGNGWRGPIKQLPAGAPPLPSLIQREWFSPLPFPKGAKRLNRGEFTQSVYTNNGDHIDRVPVANLAVKWRTSGGLEGITGWRSDKYRLIPSGPTKVRTWVGDIMVATDSGFQAQKGIRREYPIGSEFHDVLSNDQGEPFEHRVRRKDENGNWHFEVLHENKDARPPGYNGLSQSCNSCHSEAGKGVYGSDTALNPGGDTIFSDPLDWTVLETASRTVSAPVRQVVMMTPQIHQQVAMPMVMPMQHMMPAPMAMSMMAQPSGGAVCST